MNFYIVTLIKFGQVAFVFLTALAYLQWIERKVTGSTSWMNS